MGFFNKIKEKFFGQSVTQNEKYVAGLDKSGKGLSDKINQLAARYRTIDEDYFEELENILIMSDVGVNMVMKIVDEIKKEVRLENITDPNLINDIIIDKMFVIYANDSFMTTDINYNPNGLTVILMVGVNGAGKTTTIAKLAHKMINEEHKTVMVAAGDTFRAGAIDQLAVWAERLGVDIVKGREGGDPSAVVFDAIKQAKEKNVDVLICDTAGRLQNKVNLMNELEKTNRVISREIPEGAHETLLVIDATTGQNGVSQAVEFSKITNITGIVLTKMDGTAKGGIVLSIKDQLNIPVKFIGLGEKLDDLDVFHADRIAQRILGMGDVISFVEKAQQVYTKEQNEEIKRKIKNKEFSYVDIIKQFDMIQKIGGFKNVVDMLPLPVGNFEAKFQDGEQFIKKFRYIVDSMTPAEREDDIKLTITRRSRIAKGSGTSINDVDQVVKFFETMKKSLQQLRSGKMKTMLEMLKKQNGNKK